MGSDFQFRKRIVVAVHGHQACGQGVVVLRALVQAEGLAKFLFRIGQLLGINVRSSQIVVSKGGIGVQRHGFAQRFHRFFIFSC